MKIIDYQSRPEILSWFRSAGISIDGLLALRRVPAFTMLGKGAISRTNPMPAFKIETPIPSYDAAFNRGFAALMQATAVSLLAEGKLIRLAWSGGLDSTGALLALKQAGATRAQVEVHYTDESVAEYPALLPFIEQNFTAVKMAQVIPAVSADSLWVTGEGGNQVFFPISATKFSVLRDRFAQSGWEDFFFHEPDDATYRIDDRSKTAARGVMAACPFPVVTVEQAQWWRIFSLHWQHIALRQGAPLSKADFVIYLATARHFFMTPAWQRWAMKRMSNKAADTQFLMIKKPLKDFINAVYPDQNYYDTKAAEGSYNVRIDRPYVRFSDGSTPADELEFRALVAA